MWNLASVVVLAPHGAGPWVAVPAISVYNNLGFRMIDTTGHR